MLGARDGGFSRIVVAEVDETVKKALSVSGGEITVNVAKSDKVVAETVTGIEVLNPLDPDDLRKLETAAAEADEIATALPSVDFFKHVAQWMRKGFAVAPTKRRFIYTAENNNHAAERLKEAIDMDDLPNTHYLNTVVGKMSSVLPDGEYQKLSLAPLSPELNRAHLVEAFNNILISDAPEIEQRNTKGLHVKKDLYPFEEAKLYGHNAIHFMLALLGKRKGALNMSDLGKDQELMEFARIAFIEECGKALCLKWDGQDELFTSEGFERYATDLLTRMTNPFLNDSTERITRDLPRKLSWDDRVVGTIRLAVSQGVNPAKIAECAKIAAEELFGANADLHAEFAEIWPSPWTDEHQRILDLIEKNA
jgi:mannitol-1-phosphate/altronate dehydrogenase